MPTSFTNCLRTRVNRSFQAICISYQRVPSLHCLQLVTLFVMSLQSFHLPDGILCHIFVVGFTLLFHGYMDPWLDFYGAFQLFLFRGCADTIAILQLHVWIDFMGSYGIYSTLNVSCTLFWHTTICPIP